MVFQEKIEEFLDRSQGFASRAYILTGKGDEYYIDGIFSCIYEGVEISTKGVDINGDNPIFECKESDIDGVINQGDMIMELITKLIIRIKNIIL